MGNAGRIAKRMVAESEGARREREIHELSQQWEQPATEKPGAVAGYHDLPDDFAKSYVCTALWSSYDADGPLDDRFGPEHIDRATMRAMLEDCDKFQRENADDIDGRDEQAGHDFWLTRNRHGAGFWDGDWPDPAASRLTSAAVAFGEHNLEIGDEHYDDYDDDYDDDDDGQDGDGPSRDPDVAKPQLQFARLSQNFDAIAARVTVAIIEEAPPDEVLADSGRWEGRGGTSSEVRCLGLRPAFRYSLTGEIFYDPEHFVHLPTAVPRRLWAETDEDGDFRRFVPGIEQGFVSVDDPSRFVTRPDAAALSAEVE